MVTKPEQAKDLTALLEDEAGMLEAISQAVREAVRRDLILGYPVCEWRDGAVHWIQPTDPEALELIHGQRPS
jgi:hypothetical protein